MILKLYRTQVLPTCVKGNLYVDGFLECFTLELPLLFEGTYNVPDKTCIPEGTYGVNRNAASKFGPNTPLLVGVPGRSNVELHPGNTPADTDGCILVGAQWVNGAEIAHAAIAFETLTDKLNAAWKSDEPVSLAVESLFEVEDVPANG